MRISSQQMYADLLAGIRQQMTVQTEGQASIASGKRFLNPAKASLDYKVSMDIRHSLTGVQGSLKAIKTAQSRMQFSQSILTNMQNIFTRAQTLAIQLGSGNTNAGNRQAAAIEIGQLHDRLLNLANSRWQGQSVFSGTAINQDAFISDPVTGAVSYNGNNQDRVVAISSNQTITSNVRGDRAAFSNAFSSIEALQTALLANDEVGIRNTITSLNSAGDGMIDLNSEIGGRLHTLDLQFQSYEDIRAMLDQRLADHEAVDIPATVSRIQQASIALQAIYAEVAKLQNMSLINFLK